MSKHISAYDSRATIRWKLLTSASALALTAYVASASIASADDSGRPLLWIELGGQFNDLSDAQEPFAPPFVPTLAQYGVLSPVRVQSPPHYGFEDDAKLSFQPEDSDWMLFASIRYGRSGAERKQHQQTPNKVVTGYLGILKLFGISPYLSKYPSSHVKFADASAKQGESHLILDFQAGKDVGLGLFGTHGSSTISAGIRIAQFTSKSNTTMHLEPDVQYPTAPIVGTTAFIAFRTGQTIRFHDYAAGANFKRSFQGIGPSLAWDASMPVAGSTDAGELAVDWGANAAILFGRQKMSGHHQTTAKTYVKTHYGSAGCNYLRRTNPAQGFCTKSIAQHANVANPDRTRSVVVPNLGGFAGFSYRIEDFKVSFGYRADFFFGAIDGGIDTRKEENRGFFGPFASISVGLP